MCKRCESIDPSEATKVAEDERRAINHLLGSVEEVMKEINELEDQYRLIGLTYHTTSYKAREIMASMPIFSDGITHLEDYFEPEDLDTFARWDEKMNTALEKLSRLRSDMQHIPQKWTAKQIVHLAETVIKPAIQDATWFMANERGIQMELAMEVDTLHGLNDDNDVDIMPPTWWGKEVDLDTGKMMLASEGPEWETFLTWVSCLPETRKAVEQGRELKDVALGWLWDREDGEVPGRKLLLCIEDGRVF